MKFKVLLIDDEPGALEGLQMWLDWRELGFEVCGTGSNGVEGLALMKRLQPDLVVTDVSMPLMNGLDMIGAWQREGIKPVKFAVLSGYSDFEYARTSIRHGVNHYLLKPVIPEEAEQALKELYEELVETSAKRTIEGIAMQEEAAQCLRRLLLGQPAEPSDQAALDRFSAEACLWNVCLIRAEEPFFAGIKETIDELLKERKLAYVVDVAPNSFVVVYGSDDARAACEDGLPRELQAQLLPKFASQFTLATGLERNHLVEISDCYAAATEAMRYGFYGMDTAGLISYHNIRNHPFGTLPDAAQLIKDMIAAVTLLDPAAYRHLVETAASSFRARLVAPEIVIQLAVHTMFQILDLVRKAAGNHAEALIEKYAVLKSSACPTLEDAAGRLLSYGLDSIGLMRSERTKHAQGIVQEMNAYIQEHYNECLTIKQLSEVFYMHPAYLGQLLMKKNGIGFHQMLHDLRIEAAVRLLEESELKNSEIAESVGYGQYGSFLKHFEARMKVTPSEYRKSRF